MRKQNIYHLCAEFNRWIDNRFVWRSMVIDVNAKFKLPHINTQIFSEIITFFCCHRDESHGSTFCFIYEISASVTWSELRHAENHIVFIIKFITWAKIRSLFQSLRFIQKHMQNANHEKFTHEKTKPLPRMNRTIRFAAIPLFGNSLALVITIGRNCVPNGCWPLSVMVKW